MLSKSKNIAKRWEGCFKSHFSHIRNKVEKVTLGPLNLEWFLEPKSIQDREKVVSKSLQKSIWFFIRFLTDFGFILDPTVHPQIEYFSSILLLLSILSYLGAKRVPKVLQDSSGGRFFKNFVPFWSEFSKQFQRFPTAFFIQPPS